MNFEDRFIALVTPFLDLVELEGNPTDEETAKYFDIDGRIPEILDRLGDLAKGDQGALSDIVNFFNDEDVSELLNHNHTASLLKIIALASNITSDTWSRETDVGDVLNVNFLLDAVRIEQPFTAQGVPITNYFYNSIDITNSVALIDFRHDPNLTDLTNPFFWPAQGHDLVEACSVLLLLEKIGEVDNCVAVVSSEENTEKAVSYLKYHLVMSGNKLTLPVKRPTTNNVSDVQKALTMATDYTQFVEPFGMLSEVNSCDNLLDVFLSTYHVLENYMIRSEVSSVLSKTTGRNFQRVRDFRRLGQQTDASEVTHLTKLFTQCWNEKVGADLLSVSLNSYLQSTKDDPRWNVGEFDDFLVQLGITNSKGKQVTVDNGFTQEASVPNNFVKLVYAIRCSIVHNKATEFHLSNEELKKKDVRLLVIEKLCLPVMQRLAFGLPSSVPSTNPIHYERRELQFY